MSRTKEQIADAFEAKMKVYGWDKTTVDEVAEELQTSKRTIYQHFTAKKDIFQYIVSRHKEKHKKKLVKSLEKVVSQREKIQEVVKSSISKKVEKLELTSKLAHSRAVEELLSEFVKAGYQAKEFKDIDEKLTPYLINGIIQWGIIGSKQNPETLKEETILKAINRILV